MDVAVIIVSWNVRGLLADCLQSVYTALSAGDLHGSVWVVDNGSTDGSVAMVQEAYPQANLIANADNPGFGMANNQGMAAASGCWPGYYCLLNPDTVVRPDALRTLIDFLDRHPTVAMAGARLVYGDGRFQHSAFAFPGLMQLLFELFPLPARLYESGWNGRYPRERFRPEHEPFPIDHPLGATMMVRADVAQQSGGFDPLFHMYCEEIDWSWRIRKAGWEIYAVPAAEVVHYGGESTGQIAATSLLHLWQSRAKLYFRHYGRWRFWLARALVQMGMARKMVQTADLERQAVYEEIMHTWRTIAEE